MVGGEYGFVRASTAAGVTMLLPLAVVSCVHPASVSNAAGGALSLSSEALELDACEPARLCEW